MKLVRFAITPVLALSMLVLAREPEAAPPVPAPSPPAQHGGTVAGKVVFVQKGKSVQREDGFVFLKPAQHGRTTVTPRVANMRQHDLEFCPWRLVVPVGSTVVFPNDDNDEHNVFASLPVAFNLKKHGHGEAPKTTFKTPGVYDIYCDLHPWMNGKIDVVESDQIARVDTDGRFLLRDVPPGDYKLYAWEPSMLTTPNKPAEVSFPTLLNITAGTTLDVPFELHIQVGPVITNPPHKRADDSIYDPRKNYGKPPTKKRC